jgi:type II secretory pathway component PulJ
MKLIEVLIALLIFSIFSLGVISQLDAEAKLYLHRIERLNELEAKIKVLQN